MKGNLVLPNVDYFVDEITDIFEITKANKHGHVADYIPQLARVNPESYAISICTVDGQRYNIGDSQEPYSVQSTCKPINYCLALEDNKEEKVHMHIVREPSGRGFNELSLNNDSLPHNPMINSGAIMACSLIKSALNISDRFDYVLKKWRTVW